MKNFKLSLLSFTALVLLALSSCSVQPEDLEVNPSLQGEEVLSVQTFHSLMPGTLDEVYQMEVTSFADGSTEAVRSILPFNPNLDYSSYYFAGANDVTETENNLEVHFEGETWFVPFDPQIQPAMMAAGGGFSVSIICTCSSIGNCDAKVTWGADGSGSAECINRDCQGSCNAEITYYSTNQGNINGLLIATQEVISN